jgi:hypothetical protein
MLPTSRWRSGLCTTGALALVAAALGAFGGCGLSTSGGGKPPTPCETIADCDDGNICTTDRCDEESGDCESKAAPDGDPLEQTPGDCQSVTCNDGEEQATADDMDADDHDPCTDDTCDEGVAEHAPLADGSPCQLGTSEGACNAGKCQVSCTAGDECDDGEPCTNDSCDVDAKVCIFEALHGDQTPGTTDEPNDCLYEVCLNGESITVADDLEVADDGNECTADKCEGGAPQFELLLGEPCSGGYCSTRAECVECVEPSHCGGDGACFQRTCDNWTCGVINSPAGPLRDLTSGDCHARSCDGNGNEMQPVDPGDIPAGDGNQCTGEQCNGGSPDHPALHGQSCSQNGGKICNSSTCVDCLNDSHCSWPDSCGGGNVGNQCGCTQNSNSSTCSGKCGTVYNNCNVAVGCGGCPSGKTCGGGGSDNVCGCSPSSCCDGSKNGNETDVDCGGGTCKKCPNGDSCNSGSDCVSGNCHPGQDYCQ